VPPVHTLPLVYCVLKICQSAATCIVGVNGQSAAHSSCAHSPSGSLQCRYLRLAAQYTHIHTLRHRATACPAALSQLLSAIQPCAVHAKHTYLCSVGECEGCDLGGKLGLQGAGGCQVEGLGLKLVGDQGAVTVPAVIRSQQKIIGQ
jgi:DNA-binding helix-hairpin-helix protein with protein kinase domain